MSLCINPRCGQPQNADNLLFCEICGSQLLLEGKYRVVKVLSKKGGFANTYEVTEQQQAKVLKVLKSEDPKAVELFVREFEVLSSLQVAGIPKVEALFLYRSFHSNQPMYCIVMQKIEGVDLEEYLVELRHPIDQKVAINWLAQMLQILQPLHKQEIHHRDIKPSNIILQPDGQLVLIDFGAVNQSGTSLAKTLIHTPGYTSPEQEKGKTSAFSDIFSLARTMVYLLTYTDPNDLYDAQHHEFRWRHLSDNITPDFMDLIDNMMHPEIRKRPNARAILETIAALNKTSIFRIPGRSSATDQINPIATAQQASPTPRKPSRTVLLGLCSLLGLGLVTGYFWKSGLGQRNYSVSNQYFSSVKNVPIGQFRFGGSTSWSTTRQSDSSLDSSIQGAYPQFELNYTSPDPAQVKSVAAGKCARQTGSNTGICMLIEGDLDFVQSSVSLAKSKYADRVATDHLQEIAVAHDALTVVVNPRLPVTGLTIDQLRDIYTGVVTNWKQVGGPDLPIVPLSRDPAVSGTVNDFQDLVLGQDHRFNLTVVQLVDSSAAGLQRVQADLGDIYYGSAKEMFVNSCNSKPLSISVGPRSGQTKQDLPNEDREHFVSPFQAPLRSPTACWQGDRNKINRSAIQAHQYPLTRKIYVIYKADHSHSQQAGEAYAHLLTTHQGQELLEKAGFVGIDN